MKWILIFSGFSLFLNLFFFLRMLMLKKELKQLASQVKQVVNKTSRKKLTIQTAGAEVEALAEQVNELIEFLNQNMQQKLNSEKKYQFLLAEVSHDLRTPLTVIRGQLQYLLKFSAMDEPVRESLMQLISQTNHLGQFIDDFFELSLVGAPDFPIHLAPVNLNKVIMNELAEMYPIIQQKQIKPSVFMPDEPLFIEMDERAFTRIIDNLLGNALKNAEQKFSVAVFERDGSAGIKIKNDGITFSSEEFAKFLERYQTNSNDKKRRGGLGLAIVSELVKKTGGTLEYIIENRFLTISILWPELKSE